MSATVNGLAGARGGGSWVGDGSRGGSLFVDDDEKDGSVVLSITSATSGTPFNVMFDSAASLIAADDNMYFEVDVGELAGSIAVGIVRKEEFQPGWRTSGMFYNGNVTNGSGALLVGFGDHVEAGSRVGVLLRRSTTGPSAGSGSGVTVVETVFYVNGRCLGPAFQLSDDASSSQAWYPCIHASGKAKVTYVAPESIPAATERQPARHPDNEYAGDWKLVELYTGPELHECPLPEGHAIVQTLKECGGWHHGEVVDQMSTQERRDADEDKEEAERDLRSAQDGIRGIRKRDLDELRNLRRPPENTRLTLECAATMLGEEKIEWCDMRRLLGRDDFLALVVNHQPSEQLNSRQIQIAKERYLDVHPELTAQTAARSSRACGLLFKWVEAQVKCAGTGHAGAGCGGRSGLRMSTKVGNTLSCQIDVVGEVGEFDEIRVWQVASTMMMPPPELQAVEQRIRESLPNLFKMAVKDDRLIMTGPAAEFISERFLKTFEPLTHYSRS